MLNGSERGIQYDVRRKRIAGGQSASIRDGSVVAHAIGIASHIEAVTTTTRHRETRCRIDAGTGAVVRMTGRAHMMTAMTKVVLPMLVSMVMVMIRCIGRQRRQQGEAQQRNRYCA